MATKKTPNPYQALEIHPYAVKAPPTYESYLAQAVPAVHELTGVKPPATDADAVRSTLKAMGDPAPHMSAYLDALKSADPVAAAIHYSRAMTAKSAAAAATGDPETVKLLKDLELAHFQKLIAYVVENIGTARDLYNKAAAQFTEAWHSELAAIGHLSEQSVTLTPERYEAYEKAAAALPIINTGQNIYGLLPQLFDLPRHTYLHPYTVGNALPPGPEKIPTPETETGAAYGVPTSMPSRVVNLVTLREIAEQGRYLNALPRPGEQIRLYWKLPDEQAAEATTFKRLYQEVGTSSYRAVLDWWSEQD